MTTVINKVDGNYTEMSYLVMMYILIPLIPY